MDKGGASLVRWTRKSILEEIERLHRKGESLSYAAAEEAHLNLVRAAAWHFGTWRRAVEQAGLDYEALSCYQRWDRQRIVQRIQEMHQAGSDLSWREVSLRLDPALAAAALRPNGFSSWRDAIQAAGLDINEVARYKRWDEARVVATIAEMHQRDMPLSSRTVQESDQPLFCAARRRFGSWDAALEAAGLNADEIRLRRVTQSTSQRRGPRRGAKRKAELRPSKDLRRAGSGELQLSSSTTAFTAKTPSRSQTQDIADAQVQPLKKPRSSARTKTQTPIKSANQQVSSQPRKRRS